MLGAISTKMSKSYNNKFINNEIRLIRKACPHQRRVILLKISQFPNSVQVKDDDSLFLLNLEKDLQNNISTILNFHSIYLNANNTRKFALIVILQNLPCIRSTTPCIFLFLPTIPYSLLSLPQKQGWLTFIAPTLLQFIKVIYIFSQFLALPACLPSFPLSYTYHSFHQQIRMHKVLCSRHVIFIFLHISNLLAGALQILGNQLSI